MYIPAISTEIFKQLKAAEEKFPGWPKDVVHAAAIVAEECGELVKSSIDFYYGRGNKAELLLEASQTGAMVYRFLTCLEKYRSDLPTVEQIREWEKEDEQGSKEGS